MRVLGLLLVGSLSAYGQVQWNCMPVHFNGQTRTVFFDSTDSTLYVAGLMASPNGGLTHRLISISPDGSSFQLPDPQIAPTVITKWNGKLIIGGFGQPSGLAELNGNSWRRIDSTSQYAVFSLYPYQGKLLVGGSYSDSVNYSGALKEYDGTSLTSFKGLDSVWKSYAVSAIIEYKGDLIVAGNLDPYPPVDPRFKEIARWTGTSWQPLGNGITGGGNDMVYDMKVIGDDLYVAGIFREAWGGPGNSVARWDGTNWHKLAGTAIPNSGVYDLELQGDTLIFTGGFYSVDGKPANSLTRYWNGHWCNNDVALDNIINSAINYFGNVVVTGGFTTVGTDTCGYLAKVISWGDCFAQAVAGVSSSPQSGTLGLHASPNPTYDRVQVEYTAAQKGSVHIRLVDMLGKTVVAHDIPSVPGANRFAIDLTGLSTGIYHLQLSNSEGHGAIKIVKQ